MGLNFCMTCPECRRNITGADVRAERCDYCNTEICVPNSYHRWTDIPAYLVLALVAIKTFSPQFLEHTWLGTLWFWMLAVVVALVKLLISMFIPPKIQPKYVNEDITRLHLE